MGRPSLTPRGSDAPSSPRTRGRRLGIALRLAAVLVSVGLLVSLATWVMLGLTVMPTVRAGDGVWLAKRSPWVEGAAPVGERAIAQHHPVDRSVSGRLLLLFGIDAENAVVRVVATPASPGRKVPGGVAVVGADGGTTVYRLPPGDPWTPAAGEYIAVCESGACGMPGGAVSIPVENVLGRALTPVLGG